LAVLDCLVPTSSSSTISPRPRSDRPTYNHRPRHLLGKGFSIVDVSGWYKIPLLSIGRNRSGDLSSPLWSRLSSAVGGPPRSYHPSNPILYPGASHQTRL
jgi:hypothetical protein